MNKPQGWDETVAFTGEFETLPLGGHICIIKKAIVETTKTGKEVLVIGFDIASGESKGFYQRQFDRNKESNQDAKWSGMYRQLTEGNSLSFFKGMITSIEKSNQGYTWNWDENTLKGKLFGGVFGQEEYINTKGELKLATKCMQIRSVEQIQKGVEIPPTKKITGGESFKIDEIPVDDSDLPF